MLVRSSILATAALAATLGACSSGSDTAASSTTAHCPAAAPAAGSACTVASLADPPSLPDGVSIDPALCTWDCAFGHCDNGTWSVVTPKGGCPPAQPSACPAAQPTSGTSCDEVVSPCRYDGGAACACVDCGPIGAPCSAHQGKRWVCASPAAGCPDTEPRPGDACASEGQYCVYGAAACYGAAELVCTQGQWYATARVCPL